ncbi:hypothetical protein HCN44_006739 [Aphidius gifuensis]|uniref:HMG box domain-containing protein n=1 Tax=Aphidius gifuensis TaxID=684658 RepID=A0A834Y2N8_APHGI|nr:uncharacterized protein LOC122849921 [Aphidius gifuensis]KAF7995632.1 hypothetical protein HCN44_006739 [Aphidius gifuensis]
MGIRSSAPVKSNNLRERLKNNHHHYHHHHDHNDPLTSTDGQIPSSSPPLRKYKYENKKLTTNPFLIFYLRLKSKKPRQHVTVIAKIAGKLWTKMTPEQRKKYIDIAEAEKKRREEKKRKKKRKKHYISNSLKK